MQLVKQMTCSPRGETDRYLEAASVYLFFFFSFLFFFFFLLKKGRIVSLLTEDEGMPGTVYKENGDCKTVPQPGLSK
jgi:hypothetical protein